MNLQKLRNIGIWLDRNTERYLLVATYFYITIVTVLGVVNRFGLQSVSGWEQETARLLFIWLTWIGASLAIRRRSHIRIDFIYQYVSERSKGLLYIFSDICVMGFCAVAFDAFLPVLQTTTEYGATIVTLPISIAVFQAAIPAGLLLMFIRASQMLIRDVRDVRKNNEMFEGIPLFQLVEEDDVQTPQKEEI